MSAKDLAKVIWRWRALPGQVTADYRCHRQFRGLPSSFVRRFVEQQRLLWSNRIRAVDYYELGLFDPTISAASKRKYIGQFKTRQLLFAINSKEFHKVTDDKSQFNALATEAGLPVPEILAIVEKKGPRAGGPATLNSIDELRAWFIENDIADVILKPVDGLKGWGVLSLGARSGDGTCWRKLPGGELIDLAAVWAHCERYMDQGGVIIQRRLLPHPVLARILPGVLHTVRVVTYLKPEPRIVGAVMRIGSGKGPTDNINQGGIAVPVDLATGRCDRGSVLVDGMPQFVDDHPVTGMRITGVLLPDWEKVCELARSAAQTFNMQMTIGWDIGLTTGGPVLLEGNWCYGMRVYQLGNRRGMLETPWVDIFNNEGAYRLLSLGFRHRREE
jgi:hypothetical protein